MALIQINGVDIKDPSSYEYQRYDLDAEDGTGRNQKGDMCRDRQAIKVKLVCSWPALTKSEMRALLQAVKDTFFSVTYLDAYTGDYTTKTMYVGDRSAPLWYKDYWQGLTMDFIEK